MKRPQLALFLIASLLSCGLAGLLLLRSGPSLPSMPEEPGEQGARETDTRAASLSEIEAQDSRNLNLEGPLESNPVSPVREAVHGATQSLVARFWVYTEVDDESVGVGESRVRWKLSDGEGTVYGEGAAAADSNGLGELELELPPDPEALYLELHGEKQGWIQEHECSAHGWDVELFRESLEERLELYLDRGVWLKGVVYDPDGELSEDCQIHARLVTDDPDEGESADGYCDEGQFALPLYEEGLWDLTAVSEDVGTALARNILITRAEDPAPLELRLQGGGSLAGVVLGADGKPLASVQVHAVLASELEKAGGKLASLKAHHLARSRPENGAFGSRRATRISNGSGEFQIGGLEPGRYAVACLHPAGDRYAASDVVLAHTGGDRVELQIGLCLLTVHIEVDPAPESPDFIAAHQSFELTCTRADPRNEGPGALGAKRYSIPSVLEQPRESRFLVVPGHVYEVQARIQTMTPHVLGGFSLGGMGQLGGFISFGASTDVTAIPPPPPAHPHENTANWLGLEAKALLAVPRGTGRREVTLHIPAPRKPGALNFVAANEETEASHTWSLALFSETEELVSNHELWTRTVSRSELPLSVPVQPGRFLLRMHSSLQQGSPILFDGQSLTSELTAPNVLGSFLPSVHFSIFEDDGVETWLRFEIREGESHKLALEHLEGGALELGLDVHLNGSEEALDLGEKGQDLAELWRARRLVRDASGAWRHIDLDPIQQPSDAPRATTWYRCKKALAPGSWTLRLETSIYGTLEADFVVQAGQTTRVQLRADLE